MSAEARERYEVVIDPQSLSIGWEGTTMDMSRAKAACSGELKGLEAEKIVRKNLEKVFKRLLSKRTLVVGVRSSGEEIKHEFDLVSEDKSIVGEVKSDKYTEKHHENTRLPRIL